ncbi:MAG: hypothetical protein SGARI_003300 [Bacillariaceae sp.]
MSAEIEENWFLDVPSYHPVQRNNNHEVLAKDQPLFVHQSTGSPFLPGQTIKRSDLPDYFQNDRNRDHFFDAEHPNILILQDILHVEPTSTTKHIDFSKAFHSAKSKSHCTKEGYDNLGLLEITGFGGEAHFKGNTHYLATSQSHDHAGNNVLINDGMSSDIQKHILAVFQPIHGWPEKGDEVGGSVAINPHQNQELRFLDYYIVDHFRMGEIHDHFARFAEYPGLIESNEMESSFLHSRPYQFFLKKAFSFETLSQMASGSTPLQPFPLGFQGSESAVYFRKIRIPQGDLLRIQEEKYPGRYKRLLAARNQDPQPEYLEDDFPEFASGDTVVGDVWHGKVLEAYLDHLAKEDFMDMLLSTQTKPELIDRAAIAAAEKINNSDDDDISSQAHRLHDCPFTVIVWTVAAVAVAVVVAILRTE